MDRMMICPRCWGSRLEPGIPVCVACHRCSGHGSVPDQQLSNHFWLSELIESDTALAKGIPNDPTSEQIENLQALVDDDLEPIRRKAGVPILISSGFRSDDLNKALRGSAKRSAHRDGDAGDMKTGRRAAVSIPRLVEIVLEAKVPFDQLILEPTWVHIGRRGPGGSVRGQTLMMFREVDEKRSTPERRVLKPCYYPLDLKDPRVLSMTH